MDIIAHITKYNSLSNGRDKLCRLCQYASRYAGWYASTHGHMNLIQKFKSLENSLSSSRKVLRLGKSMDMVQGALNSTSISDPLIRICLIVSKLNTAMYLLVDHYVWAAKIGLTNTDPKRLSRAASRFWLAALICNLIRNVYDILNIIQNHSREQRRSQQRSVSDEHRARSRTLLGAVLGNKPVMVDTIKNAADLLLPLNNLGFADTPVQVQSILGMISSVMGILSVWNSNLKLKP